MTGAPELSELRMRERAALYRAESARFADWAAGVGVVRHTDLTQVRVYEAADLLEKRRLLSREGFYRLLFAADRLCSAAMWLAVHMSYAQRVRLDGSDLLAADFKDRPEGYVTSSLNMVPAYIGYLVANAASGITRSWILGRGHTVAAVQACNVLVDNLDEAQAERYPLSDAGLSALVSDFYDYVTDACGRPRSPLGSRVNAHTAGGVISGGYPGLAEMLWVHMPLVGERLVAFLDDGGLETQHAGDWAPRWWRAEDSGLATPMMIVGDRPIAQRTGLAQAGGTTWLHAHLEHNSFWPIHIDGRDPAAFCWAILEAEERLATPARAVREGQATYPVPMPFVIAEAPKGYGFLGAGSGARSLPLLGSPRTDATVRSAFHDGVRRLWVPVKEVLAARELLAKHKAQGRVKERDHAIAKRKVTNLSLPTPSWRPLSARGGGRGSPMDAVDSYFAQLVRNNPGLRARVGNPDEMSENRMEQTLAVLKHRVCAVEHEAIESVIGGVITARNEEAVACAALGNRGGINLLFSDEAFAVRMLGALRQEIVFARNLRLAKKPPGWLSVCVLLAPHTWESSKNEQSHQDPTFCEALLGEMADSARVVFAADSNSAVAGLREAYTTTGRIFAMVVPKHPVADVLSAEKAERLVELGAMRLRGEADSPLQLIAVGAYQLAEVHKASNRLQAQHVAHQVVYVYEPGRLRQPRDAEEAGFVLQQGLYEQLFPPTVAARVIVTHTRPEPLIGALRRLDLGPGPTRVLGYCNQGGTLDIDGMLLANSCTWRHVLQAAAEASSLASDSFLRGKEERHGMPPC